MYRGKGWYITWANTSAIATSDFCPPDSSTNAAFQWNAMPTCFPRVIGVVSDANRDFFVNILSMNENKSGLRRKSARCLSLESRSYSFRMENQSFTERFEMLGDRLESRFVQFLHSNIRVVDESTERIHSLFDHLRSL